MKPRRANLFNFLLFYISLAVTGFPKDLVY